MRSRSLLTGTMPPPEEDDDVSASPAPAASKCPFAAAMAVAGAAAGSSGSGSGTRTGSSTATSKGGVSTTTAAAAPAASKCPFAAMANASAAASDAKNSSNAGSTSIGLGEFLDQHNKSQFYPLLVGANISTVDAIAQSSVEDLARILPSKTVARLLHKKAVEVSPPQSQEEDAIDTSTSKAPSSRVPPLRQFLQDVGKEKFYDQLIGANINTVKELAASSVESLAAGTLPKTIARIVQKKASELVASIAPPPSASALSTAVDTNASSTIDRKGTNGGPECPTKLPTQTIVDIRKIWGKIQAGGADGSTSFGELFYTKLMSMDTKAVELFGAAPMSILSRDFDLALTGFIASLSPFPGGPIVDRRDDFVRRLVKYGSSARTLWLAGDAFRSAAIAVLPRLAAEKSHRGLDPWSELYQTLVPPLHPRILGSIRYADPVRLKNVEVKDSIVKALLRTGRFYAADLLSQHCPELLDVLCDCITTLGSWKAGQSTWDSFEKSCSRLSNCLSGHSRQLTEDSNHGQDHRSASVSVDATCALLTSSLPAAIHHLYGENDCEFCSEMEDSLLVVAANLVGVNDMIGALRSRQLDDVMDSWHQVYSRAKQHFGSTFYDRFLTDPIIARVFTRTEFAMQRERFVHQLNAIIIRFGEDMDKVLLPLIYELGARHRIHFSVGLHELHSITKVIVDTMKDMYGGVFWNSQLEEAWCYAADFLISTMTVGWTCGMEMLEADAHGIVDLAQIDELTTSSSMNIWAVIDMSKVRSLRDSSTEDFAAFFLSFATEHDPSQVPLSVAKRYQDVVDLILDEDDVMLSRDRLNMLGRRHHKFHGVTVEQLQKSSEVWMTNAAKTFGPGFTYDKALEWARFWTLISSSFHPSYTSANGCPSPEAMASSYRPKIDLASALKKKNFKSNLSLEKKLDLPGKVAHLTFRCDPPLDPAFKAGQYAKIRWTLPDGKEKTRFYSIASPPAIEAPNKKLELCIKEVSNGAVSRFVVGQNFAPPATCQLVMTSGHFTLPSPLANTNRLMISGGIGIVAFIGVIRSTAELCLANKLGNSRISLTLLHCERSLDFPFKDVLLGLAEKFHRDKNEDFEFSLTLCITRAEAEEVEKAASMAPYVSWKTERPDRDIVDSCWSDISALQDGKVSPHVYVCGPGPFQKALRKTLIDGMGLNKRQVHQEFFDL